MLSSKYYDSKNDSPIDMDTDGCNLSDWGRLHGEYKFAKHPKGFNIFLHPNMLVLSDEYAVSDPYSVEIGLDTMFQKRRIDLTVKLVVDAVSSFLHKPYILDIGCGQGHITESIRHAIHNSDISGLDYSVSAIEYANYHFPSIDFAVGDACNTPYASNFFDVVVCNNLWEHVPNPLVMLSEIKRTIKPGGFLILSTPSRYRTGNLVRVLMGKPIVFMSKHHITEYTIGQVKEQLAYGGFNVLDIISRPISRPLLSSLARWFLSIWIKLVRSHHQLEATVFFLAQK